MQKVKRNGEWITEVTSQELKRLEAACGVLQDLADLHTTVAATRDAVASVCRCVKNGVYCEAVQEIEGA